MYLVKDKRYQGLIIFEKHDETFRPPKLRGPLGIKKEKLQVAVHLAFVALVEALDE